MKLSIVIPVYNEVHTIDTILQKIFNALPEVEKEVVIVDDGSKDGTREWLTMNYGGVDIYDNTKEASSSINFSLTSEKEYQTETQINSKELLQKNPFNVKIIFHKQNQGKGAALRTGFKLATGDIIVIQDADLEYEPQDWAKMYPLILEGWADVVYGSRFYSEPHRVLYFYHLLGNKVISNLINLLCNTTLSDIEVCYKMFRKEVLEDMILTCNDFGFEVEFTVKITQSKRRWRIYETGVHYYGRSYEEGKKINWKDGVKALWYIVKFALKIG